LAFVLAIGPVTRFHRSRKLVSYLGLNPSEESSGGRRRLGAISKQGNTMVRWLLTEAVYPTGAQGSRATAGLSTVEIPKRTRGGECSHRAQVGCAYVLDAPKWSSLRELVRRQGKPGPTLVDPSPSLG
jgi:transposase